MALFGKDAQDGGFGKNLSNGAAPEEPNNTTRQSDDSLKVLHDATAAYRKIIGLALQLTHGYEETSGDPVQMAFFCANLKDEWERVYTYTVMRALAEKMNAVGKSVQVLDLMHEIQTQLSMVTQALGAAYAECVICPEHGMREAL